MAMESVNPMTGNIFHVYNEITSAEARHITKKVAQAGKKWKTTSFTQRAALLKELAQKLRDGADEYAELMASEMGKVMCEGRGEIEKCAWVCEYYADHGEVFLAPEQIPTESKKSYITYRPLGTILAVMPWNFPFWQVFRFAAPALMAGNTGILKHASNVPGCALAIENLFVSSGFPDDVFRSLLISSGKVSALISMDEIKAITLTGSTPAGQAIAAKAGTVLKKCVLELGGSDPYVILADADLEKTVETCVTSRLINAGQSCIAAKRFIVVDAVRKKFEALFTDRMKTASYGNPMDENITMGPMARKDLRDELHHQVQTSINQGAQCLTGGKIPEGNGAFYPPTVLSDVTPNMPAGKEELFGPVAAIIAARDEAEAVDLANGTVFGLGAAIFSRDIVRAEKIAAENLEAGCCFVNGFVRSDPRLPFGGIKGSGYGRELSHFGIREFVNIKTIVVEH